MVAAYRAGASLQEVAKDFKETKSTVGRWVAHAQGKRLDRIDFYDKPSGTRQPKNKSSSRLEKHSQNFLLSLDGDSTFSKKRFQ